MSELPEGWKAVPLRHITSKIGSGATPRGGKNAYHSKGTPLIRSMNVHFRGVVLDGLVFLDPAQSAELSNVIVEPNDVLLNITGASIGRVAIAPTWAGGSRVNQHVSIIRPTNEVESRFLCAWLASPKVQDFIHAENYGVTRQALTKGMIEDFQIPLPSLAEQGRIVEKLDSLNAQSTTAAAALTQIETLITRYKAAVLAAAFAKPGIGASPSKLGHVITGIKAGKNLRCVERPPEVDERGVVKVSAVTYGVFDPTQSKTLPDDFEPGADTLIQSGDFLFSRANTIELVGACTIVDTAPGNLYLSDKILRLDMPDERKAWVDLFLKSPTGRAALEEASSGNQHSMRNISQKALMEIVIPLPPLEEQAEIVAQIEAAFAQIETLARATAAARAALVQLDRALLTRAFQGKLVPQNPNTEPASDLLKRMKEAVF